MNGRVRIGQALETSAPVELDLQRLVHAFIAGSTRSGKSNTMRVVLERARGPILPSGGVVHQAVIDPEGEFASTLAQLGDYIVFNGDGPLRIDSETAPALAETFVEMGFNLIADMSDVPRDEAHAWIAGFCEKLATIKVERSPRAHGRRALVVIDEVQKYAPELSKKEKGVAYPAASSIISLVNTGAKRWVHVIAGSVRMAKVRADIRSECSTLLIGKHNRDDDREEAAKELGFRRGKNDVVEQIATLRQGNFMARGDGINDELVQVRVDLAKTEPPAELSKIARAPMPTSQAALAIAEQLKTFETKAKRDVQDLDAARERITSLERELVILSENAQADRGMTEDEFRRRFQEAERVVEERTIGLVRAAEDHVHAEWVKWADEVENERRAATEQIESALREMRTPWRPGSRATALGDNTPETPPRLAFERLVAQIPRTAPAPSTSYVETLPGAAVHRVATQTREAIAAATPRSTSSPGRRGGARDRVIMALARLAAIGTRQPEKRLVAVFAGVEPGGSTIRGVLADLVKEGLVQYPSEGSVELTTAGRAAAPRVTAPASPAALREVLESERLLNATQLAWYDEIVREPTTAVKDSLAEKFGVEPGGSTMRGILARLSALELVDYPQAGHVRAQAWVRTLGRRA